MLSSDLTALLAKVADDAPRARIVVTGYPHLLAPTAPVDPAIIIAVNQATDALNGTIAHAVAVTRATGVDIVYVDVAAEDAPLPRFAGHGIGSAEPFINATGPDAFHPNADGYLAYEAAISAVLPSAWLDGQTQLV
jgi:lysophospholipase L1-like esterase